MQIHSPNYNLDPNVDYRHQWKIGTPDALMGVEGLYAQVVIDPQRINCPHLEGTYTDCGRHAIASSRNCVLLDYHCSTECFQNGKTIPPAWQKFHEQIQGNSRLATVAEQTLTDANQHSPFRYFPYQTTLADDGEAFQELLIHTTDLKRLVTVAVDSKQFEHDTENTMQLWSVRDLSKAVTW